MEKKIREFGWWIEIVTDNPNYMYYFGAFNSYWEAEWHKSGYIEDLIEEKAKIISIDIQSCQPPENLTTPIMPISA